MGFENFEKICNTTAFPLCAVIAPVNEGSSFRGVLPVCYGRSVELANTMMFQVGNAFIHFGSLIVVLMIIFNVRAKYTAIGRSEMLFFFYCFIGLVVSSLVVDCGVSPPSSSSYPYFVSVQLGLISACCVSLLYNGLVCFQLWEDGSRRSLWALRIIGLGWFLVNFFVSLFTFNNWGSLNNRSLISLFVVSYVINGVILVAYVVSQVVLVFFALDSLWPLGALSLGVFFFVAGQLLAYVFSEKICNGLSHYVDGLFFASFCNLFTVMMIYKFWDMITIDDLEFSVAAVKSGVAAYGFDDDKRASTYMTYGK